MSKSALLLSGTAYAAELCCQYIYVTSAVWLRLRFAHCIVQQSRAEQSRAAPCATSAAAHEEN